MMIKYFFHKRNRMLCLLVPIVIPFEIMFFVCDVLPWDTGQCVQISEDFLISSLLDRHEFFKQKSLPPPIKSIIAR